jgi:putative transposase
MTTHHVLLEYQRSYLDDDEYEKRMGTLHYREDENMFYLHIVLLKEVDQREGNRVMGVDLNLKNVAVTSTGAFFDGGKLLWGQNHFFRVRRSLQAKGTRSAKQALARLSGRENRFVLDRLHTISRQLVEEVRSHDCSYIAVKLLTHIRENMDNRNDRIKRQIHNWAFRELQEMLAYKAAEHGISVEPIPPAFTSQTCSQCGHQSSTNRNSDGWFDCNECGYELDGDYNAVARCNLAGSQNACVLATAKNIGMKLLTVPEGKRPSGLSNGQLALKSGTLNLSDDHSSAEFRPEGESHGQAYDFSRG